MTIALTLPPLLVGTDVTSAATPLDAACDMAAGGCDAGQLLFSLDEDHLQAALVFAPEVPLSQAAMMLPLCAVAFQTALGSLAPPELAVHLDWDGGLRLNGACCGGLGIAASDNAVDAVPDWLVVTLTLPLWPPSDTDPGATPDATALFAEGCTDVSPQALLETWARHVLNWVARWETDGAHPLRDNWRGLAWGIGEPLTHQGNHGIFEDVDEAFALILRSDQDAVRLPLTSLLEIRQ